MDKIFIEKNDEVGLRAYLKGLSNRELTELAFYLSKKYGKAVATWIDLVSLYRPMNNKCEVECLINIINSGEWNKSV